MESDVRNRKARHHNKEHLKVCSETSEDDSGNNLKTKSKDDGDTDFSKKNISENISRKKDVSKKDKSASSLQFSLNLDGTSLLLFVIAFVTRIYKIDTPKGVVFDELHYGKYAGLYMQNIFFFDSQPPLGKQLIAFAAYIAGFDGAFKFERIGTPYDSTVPVVAMRLVPSFFGSLLMPTVYNLLVELGMTPCSGILAAFLLIFDNAVLAQSRYILMEGILLFFSIFGLLCVLKFRRYLKMPYTFPWFFYLISAAVSLTAAVCVRYFGIFTFFLSLYILLRDYWRLIADQTISDLQLLIQIIIRVFVFICVPLAIYFSCFYLHITLLYKAGPNDNIMTSAFQASLEGGLAAIIANQPTKVLHGSQITLRHTHGRTCWIHSHDVVYPVKYPDDRGSSHQQQVTCYSYKDVNNWWIVKKPDIEELIVSEPQIPIKDGDVIQLVHGISSRTLNSHDVAAPLSPHNQEFRLIHVNSTTALKYSGRQLPDWGFRQHEIVTDKMIEQEDTIWNVEEHRYSRTDDKKEREKELIQQEMIPTDRRNLTFWDKMYELQYKMLFNNQENVAGHMYASYPLDWLFMTRGVAYWISSSSNAQIHLIGNLLIWVFGTLSVAGYCFLFIIYIMRRRRAFYDIPNNVWDQFCTIGEVLLVGYAFNYLPYFLVDRTLFLHHYLPAYVFKVCILAAMIEHVYTLISLFPKLSIISKLYIGLVGVWMCGVLYVFYQFSSVTYGNVDLSADEVMKLAWMDTWDLIIHKQ